MFYENISMSSNLICAVILLILGLNFIGSYYNEKNQCIKALEMLCSGSFFIKNYKL